MLTGREAEPDDEPLLRRFKCRNEYECANEVEEYVRSSTKWKAETPGSWVKVFYDDAAPDVLLAVVGYEYVDEDDLTLGVWISYIGVSAGHQSGGVGSETFKMVLDHLADIMPGATAGWRVHVRNRASQRMIAGIFPGLEPTYPFEHPGYLEYAVDLEPAHPELPLD